MQFGTKQDKEKESDQIAQIKTERQETNYESQKTGLFTNDIIAADMLCNHPDIQTAEQKQNCQEFVSVLFTRYTNKDIANAKIDIALVTRNMDILMLDENELRLVLFAIALHESKFRYKVGLYNKYDFCFLQVNVQTWDYRKRKKYLLVNYTERQILYDTEACIDTGLRVFLYNLGMAKKYFDYEKAKKYGLIKYVGLYHSPFNPKKAALYSDNVVGTLMQYE